MWQITDQIFKAVLISEVNARVNKRGFLFNQQRDHKDNWTVRFETNESTKKQLWP